MGSYREYTQCVRVLERSSMTSLVPSILAIPGLLVWLCVKTITYLLVSIASFLWTLYITFVWNYVILVLGNVFMAVGAGVCAIVCAAVCFIAGRKAWDDRWIRRARVSQRAEIYRHTPQLERIG